MKSFKDYFVMLALFGILTVLTMVTIIYAKEAEAEAKEVRRELNELNVSAQIRCVVRVILSYPPPVAPGEFAEVEKSFDQCILDHTGVTE